MASDHKDYVFRSTILTKIIVLGVLCFVRMMYRGIFTGFRSYSLLIFICNFFYITIPLHSSEQIAYKHKIWILYQGLFTDYSEAV